MQERTSVLCALGDERQRRFICDQLAADGYPVEPARSPSELQIRARNRPPGVLLVGRLQRRHDELELLRAVRAGDSLRADVDPAVAAIVLGADADELAILRAFAAGCDDYLACPPSYPELRARIEALARRAALRAAPSATAGSVSTRTAAWPASPAGRFGCRRSSLRCSTTWPPTRRAASRSTSCCATCGATWRPARPGPSTPTPAGCASG